MHWQIADFGLSQRVKPGQKLTKACGTWAYAAPEMSTREHGGYDCKFDTWSYGIVLFISLCGFHPFDPNGTLSSSDIRARMAGEDLWDVIGLYRDDWHSLSPAARDLLAQLLVRDPQVRFNLNV